MEKKLLTICGSMAFIDKMEALARKLESADLTVYTPKRSESADEWSRLSSQEMLTKKRTYIDEHLNLIKQSDCILIANYPKNGIEGYVGANALMEAAFAYALNILVFVLFPIGEQGCKLELESIAAEIFDGQVTVSDFGKFIFS